MTLKETETQNMDRRRFLGLMSASAGLAGMGLGGCVRKPVENILPYASRPEDLIPGRPMIYATTAQIGPSVLGLLVESQDGRPTKIEGNPDHPMSFGATNAWAQASVLELYDTDRSRVPGREGRETAMADARNFLKAQSTEFTGIYGEGLALLIESRPSPTYRKRIDDFQKLYPKAQVILHDAAYPRNARKGAAMVGMGYRPVYYRPEKADVVLALDSDFLGYEGDAVRNLHLFAQGRRLESEKDSMNRLYVVEPAFTVTGTMADNRLNLARSRVGGFLKALGAKLFSLGVPVPEGAEGVPTRLQGADGDALFEKWVLAVAGDLAAKRGKSLIIVGEGQPSELHALAHLLNHALGNVGKTLAFGPSDLPAGLGSLDELAKSMAEGSVKTLVMLGGNPVYNAPADLEFGKLLKKVPTSIHLSYYNDETSGLATRHIPASHYLEAWGDLRASDGTVGIQQPLIAPLFDSMSEIEALALLNGQEKGQGKASGYDLVKNHWAGVAGGGGGFEKTWRRWLHDGVVKHRDISEPEYAYQWGELAQALAFVPASRIPGTQSLELAFVYDSSLYDGRFANNGWLQELPDPMTKLTWDNAALLGKKTARSLGVSTGDMVEISHEGRRMEIAALITPGVADKVLVLPLGYGRNFGGAVSRNAGFDTYALRVSKGLYFASGARLKKTGAGYVLAKTQTHERMEGRPILLESSLAEYRKNPNFAGEIYHGPPLKSLWTEPNERGGHQWALSIDLNLCNGCNACTIACQAENNIPIVGKERVAQGREMHWIRLDRYFLGDGDNLEVSFQPMTCAHCENAPCESVCPVAATVHSPEGLNDMAYNRCVGTRYCANNCPYKVRNFNYFNFNKEPYNRSPLSPEISKMQKNPDVTIRFRGVMEKCTYCVQRINEAKIAAKRDGDGVVPDGAIVPACQQVCPAGAIVFGNINDPASRVSKRKSGNRDYALLVELNLHPRTTYSAKIRNPNPDLV